MLLYVFLAYLNAIQHLLCLLYTQTYRNGKRVEVLQDEYVSIQGGMPAIITKKLFDMAQEKKKINRFQGSARNATRVYMLSGLLKCGKCQSILHGSRLKQTSGNVYYKYVCSGKDENGRKCKEKDIHAHVIEHFISEKLITEIFNRNIE